MSDENKHKPLNPEELLQLLNKKMTDENNDLDEFEREALEGFDANVDSLKAEKLIEEVNQSISKKVSEDEKRVQKNKIIWFSAAASIVVIFLISIFFAKQSKQDLNSNLALNEPKNEQFVAPGMEPVIGSTTAMESNSSNDVLSTVSVEQKRPEKISLAKESAIRQDEVLVENTSSFGTIDYKSDNETKSGESEYGKDANGAPAEKIVITDQLGTKKKEQSTREESETDKDYSISQNVSTTSVAMDDTKEVSNKADLETKNTKQNSKNRSKSNEQIISAGVAANASPSAVYVANEIAYYKGGELAIKEYVMAYLKSKQISQVVVGRYKVTGIVSPEGHLKVETIVQLSNDNCNCMDKIKETLNLMKAWNPAISDGKKSSSEVEFVIGF
ncbi:MAG: hypothetical protein V4565_12735 [Bacteroidota bacterium]